MSDLLAARVNHWQAFKIRKYAEENGIPLGLVITEAIQLYFSQLNISQERIDAWLVEYHELKENHEDAVV